MIILLIIEELRKSEVAFGGFVQSSLDDAFGVAGQSPTFDRSSYHLVRQLFCRRFNQIVRFQLKLLKQCSNRLDAKLTRLIVLFNGLFVGHWLALRLAFPGFFAAGESVSIKFGSGK